MQAEELEGLLALSALLQGCTVDPKQVRVRIFLAGDTLDDHPDGVPCVGLVLSGRVEVCFAPLDKKGVQLNSLGAGDCFGVCNLLEGAPLETDLRCAQDTQVLFIPKADLWGCLERDHSFALRYAALCNQKLQFLLRRIEQLTVQSCRGRVAAYLLAHKDGSGRILEACPREELARRLGISRAALFRELAALQSAGVLQIEGGALTILDQPMLEQLLYRPSGAK